MKIRIFLVVLVVLCFCGCQNNNLTKEEIEAVVNECIDSKLADPETWFKSLKARTEGNARQQEELRAQEEELRVKEEEKRSKIIGIYKFTDHRSLTWTLKVNKDETSTMSAMVFGEEFICYGSWRVDFYDTYASLSFRFFDESPKVCFPGGFKVCSEFYIPNINIEEGNTMSDVYIYPSLSDLKAKNPKKRLPIKKVK